MHINENIIKDSEKLPNKINISLEKGKIISEKWENNKLEFLINDCLNIENNINDINNINKNFKNYNFKNSNIIFYPNEEGINQFLETIKKFGKIINLSNKIFDSKIEFDEELVKTWLNNKNFNAELLFRKTRDGSTPNDFHNKCDNKGITIIFIETDKGYKFGGYTELEWDRKSLTKKDESTFLFSFNNKEKYTHRNNNGSIYCTDSYCPWFGGPSYLEIHFNKSLNKGGSYESMNNNTFIIGRKLTNGEEYWNVKELEAFKINYI